MSPPYFQPVALGVGTPNSAKFIPTQDTYLYADDPPHVVGDGDNRHMKRVNKPNIESRLMKLSLLDFLFIHFELTFS